MESGSGIVIGLAGPALLGLAGLPWISRSWRSTHSIWKHRPRAAFAGRSDIEEGYPRSIRVGHPVMGAILESGSVGRSPSDRAALRELGWYGWFHQDRRTDAHLRAFARKPPLSVRRDESGPWPDF